MASGPSSIPPFNPSESPNYVFSVPEIPSPNMRALLAYVDALQKLDFDSVMACFDDALEHRILPKSMCRPVLNKRQYGEYFKGVMPMFKKFRVTIHEVVEANDKISVHASSIGESALGTPFANECTMIISFVPPPPSFGPGALPRMRYVKEFVDSAVVTKFYTEEHAKIKQLRAKERREREWQ